jgi:hypothetical protein
MNYYKDFLLHFRLNENSGQQATPLYFETSILCWDESEEVEWYATWDEAVTGHKNIVSESIAAL